MQQWQDTETVFYLTMRNKVKLKKIRLLIKFIRLEKLKVT